jgi:tetratricopeptide (TPR) repeat protein
MEKDPGLLEKDAHDLMAEEKFDEAYRLFRQAGNIYKKQGNHQAAALCFASAASCWALKSEERTFYNSAIAYEEAARQAETLADFEYASLLYRYAAISYERDAEFINFSECFYRSKECYRKYLALSLFYPQKVYHIARPDEQKEISIFRRVLSWFTLTISFLIWGHGERPLRTFYGVVFLILFSAFFYTHGQLTNRGMIFKPDFAQAFYFSVVTFTTVGYGDITPLGFNKLMAIIEVLGGIFFMPVFIIGLSRKYLRV